ncbi:hypothetical protein [Halopelagius longus]|uniref:Uncharacterized protein n=1 Tax=Halopelagius longus TaxID=1236180 RepID=A0A1H1GUQ8_9EURY|nr:hypothetical protein [Halopelagius longus]RDI69569.1 hypothetical protein DWB78_18635 [Halopelagius longus]SDR16586.1 hypothetical protein SAMN05216278_3854 [Halopelagius longus]
MEAKVMIFGIGPVEAAFGAVALLGAIYVALGAVDGVRGQPAVGVPHLTTRFESVLAKIGLLALLVGFVFLVLKYNLV